LSLFDELRHESTAEPAWREYFEQTIDRSERPIAIHLAILVEPYMSFVLDGSKTVESRFSRTACAPYGRVSPGDVLLLKRSAGPVIGSCRVSAVWHYRLNETTIGEIQKRFGAALCPQEGFWEERATAAYATLMRVCDARSFPPVEVSKRDRRGWVVLADQRVPRML
jgi:hypothetical protein